MIVSPLPAERYKDFTSVYLMKGSIAIFNTIQLLIELRNLEKVRKP